MGNSTSCGPTTFEKEGFCHAKFPAPMKEQIDGMDKLMRNGCKVSNISEAECDKKIEGMNNNVRTCLYDPASKSEQKLKSCIENAM